MENLFRLAGVTFFNLGKEITTTMDPLTAELTAISAVFQFLATPAGQKTVEAFITIDTDIITKLHDMFNKLHTSIEPAKPTTASK